VAKYKSAYELRESQVTTPEKVVSLFWRLTHQHRARVGTVLDMGAGDCRFVRHGKFKRYVGVEIDSSRSRDVALPKKAKLITNCVFKHRAVDYDACIGNPPYVRHHDIESPWKEDTVARINRELVVSLDKHCNLYLYFLCLGLLKTHDSGLVSLLIPYEWVSRPSAEVIRDHIQKQAWNVSVYRFQTPIFEDVLTTASVSIIDKQRCDGEWKFFDITADMRVVPRPAMAGSKRGVLKYADRGEAWALRGLSPGGQKVFTLTEQERIEAGLTKRDVQPCVTTLKDVPRPLRMLTKASFKKHFIDADARCWLIKSFQKRRSVTLNEYLKSVPVSARDNYTCRNQKPWFNYLPHGVPQMLFGSGFTKFGPKVLINSIGAHAVGSVWGIHSHEKLQKRRLQNYLLRMNFEKRVVPHAKTLKKVEVKQLNSVLNAFMAKVKPHGKAP